VDGRSDVYSLGLLLYEALAGRLPAVPPVPLHKVNREVSVGLSDIVGRCLEPDAADRYPSAAALALDLRLHLTDQPLRGVRNRSGRERWGKWRRRRPHALAVWSLLLAVGTALLTVALLVLGQQDQIRRHAEAARHEGERLLADGKYSEAALALERARTLADGLRVGGRELRKDLNTQLGVVQRAQAAQDLHAAADRVRFLCDADSLPPNEARRLEARCRAIWQARGPILAPADAALPEEMEKRIQTDLLDLALLGSELGVRLSPTGIRAAAHREALRTIDEAEALFGPRAALYRERAAHAEALGLKEEAAAARQGAAGHPPRTPWDHYALGLVLLRGGDLEGAAEQIERAIRLQPQGFWPNFYQGVCAYRRGEYEEAVRAFSVCVALAPASDRAACYFNRARAWAAQPDGAAEALRDYDSALELQPNLSAAALNRGILHYRQGRYDAARADLLHALDCGADPAAAHYNLALVHLAQDDHPAALARVKEALRHNPDHAPARELCERLRRDGG
jgi:tetratricopeptide (TPR) repeat protein